VARAGQFGRRIDAESMEASGDDRSFRFVIDLIFSSFSLLVVGMDRVDSTIHRLG
jgi:hypothetical protein